MRRGEVRRGECCLEAEVIASSLCSWRQVFRREDTWGEGGATLPPPGGGGRGGRRREVRGGGRCEEGGGEEEERRRKV